MELLTSGPTNDPNSLAGFKLPKHLEYLKGKEGIIGNSILGLVVLSLIWWFVVNINNIVDFAQSVVSLEELMLKAAFYVVPISILLYVLSSRRFKRGTTLWLDNALVRYERWVEGKDPFSTTTNGIARLAKRVFQLNEVSGEMRGILNEVVQKRDKRASEAETFFRKAAAIKKDAKYATTRTLQTAASLAEQQANNRKKQFNELLSKSARLEERVHAIEDARDMTKLNMDALQDEFDTLVELYGISDKTAHAFQLAAEALDSEDRQLVERGLQDISARTAALEGQAYNLVRIMEQPLMEFRTNQAMESLEADDAFKAWLRSSDIVNPETKQKLLDAPAPSISISSPPHERLAVQTAQAAADRYKNLLK